MCVFVWFFFLVGGGGGGGGNEMIYLGFSPLILIGLDEVSITFIGPASVNSIPTAIQIDQKLCEITGKEIFAFLHTCDLE